MRSVKSLLAAGAATLISSMAFAADMPIAAPPPMYAPPAPPADFGGWYLRGDIGMTNQSAKRIDTPLRAWLSRRRRQASASTRAAVRSRRRLSLQQLVPRRRDRPVSGQGQSARHRDRHLHRRDRRCRQLQRQQIRVGRHGERLCRSRHLVVHHPVHRRRCRRLLQQDQRLPRRRRVIHRRRPQQRRYFADNGKWNLAWAAHAGLAYKVNPGFTVELAYSYMDLGDAAPGNYPPFDNSISGRPRSRSRTSPRTTSSSACAGISTARRPTCRRARHQGLIVSLSLKTS